MSSEEATMALRSRAEVQLLNVLNQKKARSASSYLMEEQQKVLAEDEDESKQAQARRRIALEALPACSEEALIVSEVRQLEDDFFVVGAEDNQSVHTTDASPSQIEMNAVRRRERHMEAQMQYGEEVKVISEDVEAAIIRAADHVKEVLATTDAGIRVSIIALSNNELLLASDNENIQGMWRDLEAVCQRRTDEIARFAAQLDEIEQSRIHRVRVGLQRLTYVLMETAHALPPEVERIIEAEAYEVNTVVISNRRVYADLVGRIGMANVDVFLNARLAWKQIQVRWRHLRHDDAIAKFRTTLNSSLFTNPDERQHVLKQIRVFQEEVHSEQRLAVLKQLNDAGATLTSGQAKRFLEELVATQQFEEEKNQAFFLDLRGLHESKHDAARKLREALRLELHGFGAMAKEGAIEESKKTLTTLLGDNSMEDFFRAAGGLKNELDTLAKQLCTADLIYSANLEPVASSVGILLSALPLEAVMEKQGKEAERKAVQATLEKMRKASKGEIMSLLPSLQSQISMLINLDEMNDSFKGELGDIITQLEMIVQDTGSLQASYSSVPSPLKRTGSVSPVNSSGGRASSMKTVSRSPSVAAPASPKATRKSSAMFGTGSASKSKVSEEIQSSTVDLQAIRKVQRRLGTLVYASELGASWKKHLHFIADQLILQTHANHIVDEVISNECDNLIETRQQESRLLVEEIGKRMEQQSALLHDHVEKLVKYFLRVVLCMEESADKVKYINLSVMDLLDTLKENNEETLADLEMKFRQSCARLRHSPNDTILHDAFQQSSSLLMKIEGEYRVYDKRVRLAADSNVIAIAKHRAMYLQRLCDFFGMKQSSQPQIDETLNLDHFLSAQYIEQVLNPAMDIASDVSGAVLAKSQTASPNSELPLSEDNHFRTALGLELIVVLSLADLARDIVAQHEEEGRYHDEVTPTETSLANTDVSQGKESHHGGDDESGDVKLETSELLSKSVLNKVQTEFLVLNVPEDTVESTLATFRDAILTKYELDASATCEQTEETRDERHANSSMFLEERLRVHWPRKGRLDVQFYQPRMGELMNHKERQERHWRGIWQKVGDQQTAFTKKAEEALAHVEQARMMQINLQAQLPLQQSLAALQGLEVKTKKRLGVFKAESMEMLVTLGAATEGDLNSLLASCQDYIRACSSQLFPDLTSCEIISGCDYHPDEITAIKERLAAVETQARDKILEREKRIVYISDSQGEVLEMWQAFKTRYQTCMQSLAMKEGLGQKFGLPRRAAQERYRSEMNRCDARCNAINSLLTSLQSLIDEKKRDCHSEPLFEKHDFTGDVIRMLMQLRSKIYHRGMYFGFLKTPNQLEPKPVEFNPVFGQPDDDGRSIIRDHEVVDDEDRILAVPFLEFADKVSAECQDETKALYLQEGKTEDLPPSGVPTALEDYLSSQLEKAKAFVVQQEVSYREQVTLFAHLLTIVPGFVITNFTSQAKKRMGQFISEITSSFETQYQTWMNHKNEHTLELRPHLCSRNNLHLLQELEERESSRSKSTQMGLLHHRRLFLVGQIELSLVYEARLVGLCQSLMLILDSSVLSEDDLKPFSGDELPKLKRKSLKRLRKIARVIEMGDPREVKRTAAELQKLAQGGEPPRFPLRSWPSIPSFGLQSLWEEVKGDILARDAADQNLGSVVKGDHSIQSIVCTPLESNDGAYVGLLTPAHRALIRARDAAHADYSQLCRDETQKFLDQLHERLSDEVKWTLSWEKGTENMKRQQQQKSGDVI
ncbi:unnamed protein product [Phytophthora lilii]|uniref:Unnamed protein product n=1 Tax=Phytophthora lilii TaxID=2077276 RepID=A0A9W6TNV8_9STRA|nr:unnamed protein product [Phytophthora lilii]